MKIKSLLIMMCLALPILAQNSLPPPPSPIPASKEASLGFSNLLLQIQLLESQARELETRARLLRSDLPNQIQLIAKEKGIDLSKYQIVRDRNGNFTTDDEGRLLFELKPINKEVN